MQELEGMLKIRQYNENVVRSAIKRAQEIGREDEQSGEEEEQG